METKNENDLKNENSEKKTEQKQEPKKEQTEMNDEVQKENSQQQEDNQKDTKEELNEEGNESEEENKNEKNKNSSVVKEENYLFLKRRRRRQSSPPPSSTKFETKFSSPIHPTKHKGFRRAKSPSPRREWRPKGSFSRSPSPTSGPRSSFANDHMNLKKNQDAESIKFPYKKISKHKLDYVPPNKVLQSNKDTYKPPEGENFIKFIDENMPIDSDDIKTERVKQL